MPVLIHVSSLNLKVHHLVIADAAAFAPVHYVFGDGLGWCMEKSILLAISVVALLLVYRHAENINRLVKGTESRLGKKSKP